MLGKNSNPVLVQAEQALAAKIPPQLQPVAQRIVAAGLKVMYSPQSHQLMLKALSGPGDKADLAGHAASKLLGLLYTEMRGQLNMQAAIPAASMLLCEGLDFMEKSGMVPTVDKQFLARAMKSMMTSTLQLFGITPQRLAQMRQGAQQEAAPGAPPAPPAPLPPAPQPAAPAGIIAGAQGGPQ